MPIMSTVGVAYRLDGNELQSVIVPGKYLYLYVSVDVPSCIAQW